MEEKCRERLIAFNEKAGLYIVNYNDYYKD